MDADARLLSLAEAIADGLALDWDRESESAGEHERAAIRELQRIAAAARLNAEYAQQVTLSLRSSKAEALGVAADALPPVAWGPLAVHEKIGSGRFGDVYRATDPSLERDVALKLLRHDTEADGRLVVQEGRLMARVRHPNVVTIYGAQRLDGRTGLWMELVEGSSLEAELALRGPFDAAELTRVGVELCRALGAVHRAGLVHRDVKAQNVLVDASGRVVLGDFGTGQDVTDQHDPSGLVGTPAYLAPEALAGRADTPQRDLYSLGVLLFHLATGRYPITARSLGEIRAAHARGDRPTSLRELRPDLPPSLAAAIDRALQPDPARRFADASSMEAALGASTATTVPGHASTPARWMTAMAVVAAIGAGGIWLTLPPDQSHGRTAPGTPPSRAFRQISPDPTLAGPGVPSPDGRLLSYVDPETGGLAIHELATGRRWPVTHVDGQGAAGYAETSRFIEGGARLLYLWFSAESASSPGDTELRAVPVAGGESTLVWRDPDRAHVRLHHSAADDRLVLVNRWVDEARSELAVLDAAAGVVRSTIAVGRTSPYGATLSPDGTLVVFDRPDPDTRLRDLFVAAVGEPGDTPLIQDAASDHSPMWTRDGRFLLFLSDRSGPTGLWALPMAGATAMGPPMRVEPNLGWAFPMGETSEGGYFFRRQMGTRDVHTVALDASGTVVGEPVRASTEVIGANGSSDWSPDGRALTFFRRRDDRWSLVIKDLTSGREREIVDPHIVGIGRPRWEASGRTILLKATYRDRPGLYRLDVQTGRLSMVLEKQVGQYELIPGTRSILYNTRQRELWRHDLDTGRTAAVHHIEAPWFATGIAVSPDGEQLAYSASDGRGGSGLRTARLGSPEAARVIFQAPPDEYIEAYAFTTDGTAVIIKRARRSPGPLESDHSRLWAVDVASGEARVLGLDLHGLNQARLSPDGRRLSFDAGWPKQEVWVLEHLLESLPSR